MPKCVMTRRDGGDGSRGAFSWAVAGRSVRASITIVLLGSHLAGCFYYAPARSSAMPSGTDVSIGITDRGRVELAERVGPGVRRIGGQVVESTDSSLALSVTSVEYIDLSVPAKWAGERVEVSRNFVSDIRERRFSRSRTWLTVGLAAVGVIALSMITIRGFGGGSDETRPPPGNGEPD